MLNEIAKATVLVGVLAGALYAPWWVPKVRNATNESSLLTFKVSNSKESNVDIELWYHGDVIDTFGSWGDCVAVLPVGDAWACRDR